MSSCDVGEFKPGDWFVDERTLLDPPIKFIYYIINEELHCIIWAINLNQQSNQAELIRLTYYNTLPYHITSPLPPETARHYGGMVIRPATEKEITACLAAL